MNEFLSCIYFGRIKSLFELREPHNKDQTLRVLYEVKETSHATLTCRVN